MRNRDSNLELMRIVLMLLIVAHHYVINSGVMTLWTPSTLTVKGAFLTLWGMWGKVAINAFVMVTGWFMCRSDLTWKKYARLLAQVYFWKLIVWAFLVVVGADGVTPFAVVKSLLAPFRNVNGGFTASFLAMYLMIPFLNRLLGTLDRRAHLSLLGLLVCIHTIATTFFFSTTAFSELGWYCTLYILAAYLRSYEPVWSTNHGMVSRLFAMCIVLAVASVAGIMGAERVLGVDWGGVYWFVADSGKLLALACGVTCFLWFRGLELGTRPAVNAVASTTFGVFLIHAHSDCMRGWLWGKVVDVPRLYVKCSTPVLVAWSVVVPIIVFSVCSILETLRLRLLEPLFLAKLDAYEGRVDTIGNGIMQHIMKLFG